LENTLDLKDKNGKKILLGLEKLEEDKSNKNQTSIFPCFTRKMRAK
jgi:hypothetical protein